MGREIVCLLGRAHVAWMLTAVVSLGCGRTNRNPFDGQEGGSPSVPVTAGVAAGSDAGGAASGDDVSECGALIDDMEDGTGRICDGAGRVGVWYAFNSPPQSEQWPAPLPPGTPIQTSLIPGGRADSRRAMHTYGKADGWGAGIGVDLAFDGTTYGQYDASGYQGVRFWARGSTTIGTLRVRISTVSTTATEFGGTCSKGSASTKCRSGPSAVLVPLGPEWQEYTVSFENLDPVGERDRLTNIQFMADDDFDFWIDDVSFIDGPLNCCPDRPECRGGVHLADEALRSALVGDDKPEALLDCGEVCVLRRVALTDAPVRSLEGLQCLIALEELSIEGSSVEDLTPLSELTGLRDLRMKGARVSSLQALRGVARLSHLDLSHNAVTDIGPLEQLSALQILRLGGNQLRDASPVRHLSKLGALELNDNRIDELGSDWELSALGHLDLSNNQLTDVSALARLSALDRLILNNNRISDVSPLAGLTQLEEIYLAHNSLTTLNGAFAFRSLTRLDLSDNGLALIPELTFLGSTMCQVNLARNALTEVSAFEHVELVRMNDGSGGRNFGGNWIPALLDVSGNQIQAFDPLLRAGWQDVSILAADNPVDCGAEESNLQLLRERQNTVDVCR